LCPAEKQKTPRTFPRGLRSQFSGVAVSGPSMDPCRHHRRQDSNLSNSNAVPAPAARRYVQQNQPFSAEVRGERKGVIARFIALTRVICVIIVQCTLV
jgi:hypothetical protein